MNAEGIFNVRAWVWPEILTWHEHNINQIRGAEDRVIKFLTRPWNSAWKEKELVWQELDKKNGTPIGDTNVALHSVKGFSFSSIG